MIRFLHLKLALLIILYLLTDQSLHAQIDAWAETNEVCLGEQVTINSVIELPVEEYNPVYFVHNDTVFEDVFDMDFNFKFFGNLYSKFVISPNGWISFNPELAGTFSDWHATAIPNTDSLVPKNAIMFPWQDWYPYVDDGSYVGWAVLGYAPKRRLIVNFFNVTLAGNESPDERGTFQLKLFETSNLIEVHITKKPSSGSYLNNIATIGVHDDQGLRGIAPSNRNGTSWTTENEAWQFNWTGNPAFPYVVVPTDFDPELIGEIGPVKWYENTVDDGHLLSTGNTLLTYPTVTTSYIARILVNNSVPYTDTVTITVNPLPVADAGVDQIITISLPVTLHGSASNGTPPYEFFWESADGTWKSNEQNPTFYPITSMEYKLYVKDAKGCISGFDYVVVEVTNSPLFVTISASSTTICKGDDVTLTVTAYGGTKPYSYEWNADPIVDGWVPADDPVQVVNPEDTTTFYAKITDKDGEIFTVSIVVNVISVQPSIEGLTDVCEQQTGVIYTAPPSGNTFLWSMTGDVPGDLPFINNIATANFGAGSGVNTIKVIETTNDLYKCTGSAEIAVNIHPKPSPFISDAGGNPVCQGTMNVLYSTDFHDGHSYVWDMVYNYGAFVDSDSLHEQVRIDWHLPGQELLALTVKSDYGCMRTVTKDIVINPRPTPLISGREMICEKETALYSTTYYDDHSYSWDTLSPFPGDFLTDLLTNEVKVSWKQPGTATMTVTEMNDYHCSAESKPFTAIVRAKPVLSVDSDSPTCAGEPVHVELSGADTYEWQPNEGLINTGNASWIVNAAESKEYIVTGSIQYDTVRCSSTLPVTVTIKPNPIPDLGPDQYIEPGKSITLDPGTDFDTYEWNTGSFFSTLEVTAAGTYYVKVSQDGCFGLDTILVKMPAGLLPIPTAFSPNSDGINDKFGLVGSLEEITRFSMQIYNRWGALLYETSNPGQPWDGTYQGILCDTGTYLWIISVEEKSLGQSITNRGYVTLLR